MGKQPVDAFQEFGRVCKQVPSRRSKAQLAPGEAMLWHVHGRESPRQLKIAPSHTERRRHTRKYAEGELPPERSFYFRGPQNKLKLRAHNLILFLQMADGVDEDTWTHHLQAATTPSGSANAIKDDELADQIQQIEQDGALSADESLRARASEADRSRRYTLPATASPPETPKASKQEGSAKPRPD